MSVEYIIIRKTEPKVKPQKTKIISGVAIHLNCEFDNYEIDSATE